MSIDYSSKQIWEDRFTKNPDTFEWLGETDELLPFIAPYLQPLLNTSIASQATQILHMGCGTSQLSFSIQEKLGVLPEHIVNLDYSNKAIELGQAVEVGRTTTARMHWVVADLLDWKNIQHQLSAIPVATGTVNISLIVEKSCSDALACGHGVTIPASNFPFLAPSQTPNRHEIKDMEPMQLAAIHLAALVKPNEGYWIAMSYSSSRFDFLERLFDDDVVLSGGVETAGELWKLVHREEKEVAEKIPEGSASTVHRPPVVNHVYVLRRTDVPLEGQLGNNTSERVDLYD